MQVISREEGSGTRSAFAELVSFDTSTDGTKEDDTTDDAIIADSTEAVIAAVAANSSAIGYISMGAASDSTDIKVLAVDGTEATTENVQDESYSLSRPFSLAWSGKLSDLEQDFLTYVLGSGQAIVDARQNENMKFLTIISTIFFPLTLITGWYGMNFENMPELETGYPVIILVSVVVVLICLVIFKKKKIL